MKRFKKVAEVLVVVFLLLFSLSVIIAFFAALYEKQVHPNTKNLDGVGFFFFGLLSVGMLVASIIMVRWLYKRSQR